MGARRRLSLRLFREIGSLVLRRRRVFRVTGHSMVPTLWPGDVVAVATRPGRLPTPGEVVVVHDPGRPGRALVKRARSRGERSFAVGSDAPLEARDSRHFGSLPPESLIGRVLWAWSRERGFRPLRPGR